jgi:hypothetical protein
LKTQVEEILSAWWEWDHAPLPDKERARKSLFNLLEQAIGDRPLKPDQLLPRPSAPQRRRAI